MEKRKNGLQRLDPINIVELNQAKPALAFLASCGWRVKVQPTVHTRPKREQNKKRSHTTNTSSWQGIDGCPNKRFGVQTHMIIPCIHAYMHTRIHAFMPTCTHAYMHACLHAHMHTCIYAYMPTRLHAYMHTHAFMHTCIDAHMHTCIHACMHTCTHAYIHTRIHAPMHTCRHAPNLNNIHSWHQC